MATGLLVALVVLGGLAPHAAADEPQDPAAPGAALVEVCASSPIPALPQVGPGVCKTLDAGAILLALACGKLAADPPACGDLTDGRPIDPAAVTTFEHGWVHRALDLQRRLDFALPLRDALIPHTHNSFNTATEWPSLTTSDPNQRYSLTDQLRMGIRAIELDVHYLPNPAGDPAHGLNAPVLCHAETEHVGDLSLHVGCSVDRLLRSGLDEVRAWLDAPGNEQEVLLVYIQNELDGDPAAHAATVAELERGFGDLVARPPSAVPGTCQDLPILRSRADLLAEGHRVLITGNCGPGAWSSWVYQRGDGWDERGNSAGYPAFPACTADRAARGYDQHLIRVTEDQTWLSAISGAPAPITEAEVRSMVRCGVELIGLDRIGPTDPRLAALVWSWAPDEPTTAGSCARWGTDARFRSTDCAAVHRVACRGADRAWTIPPRAVRFADAFALCASAAATFDVPRTGWDDEQLRAAAAGAGELWLNLADTAAAGWQPALTSAAQVRSASAPSAPAAEPAPGPRLPATGRSSSTPLAVAGSLLALAAITRRAAAVRRS